MMTSSSSNIGSGIDTTKPYDKDYFEYIDGGHFKYISDCISCATASNGKIFGKFVLDVLHPMSMGRDLRDLMFGEINMWFTCSIDAHFFVRTMGKRLMVNSSVGVVNSEREQHYILVNDNDNIVQITIDVCPRVPVIDFDVNTLCYEGHSLEGPIWSVAGVRGKEHELVCQIEDKHANIIASYITNYIEDIRFSAEARANVQKFLDEGWKIYVPDQYGELILITSSDFPTMLDEDNDYVYASPDKDPKPSVKNDDATPVTPTLRDSSLASAFVKQTIQCYAAKIVAEVKGLTIEQIKHINTICETGI